MPRRRQTPNGFNEWLVVATIDWARQHGVERVSMNFAPFVAVFEPADGNGLGPSDRLKRRAP